VLAEDRPVLAPPSLLRMPTIQGSSSLGSINFQYNNLIQGSANPYQSVDVFDCQFIYDFYRPMTDDI